MNNKGVQVFILSCSSQIMELVPVGGERCYQVCGNAAPSGGTQQLSYPNLAIPGVDNMPSLTATGHGRLKKPQLQGPPKEARPLINVTPYPMIAQGKSPKQSMKQTEGKAESIKPRPWPPRPYTIHPALGVSSSHSAPDTTLSSCSAFSDPRSSSLSQDVLYTCCLFL